jgi:two-component system phosphate regulon response regulator PhoB
MTDLAAFEGNTHHGLHSNHIDRHNETTLRYLDIELDWRTHRVTRAQHPIHLSTLDLKLLRFLMLAPGQVFMRDEILERVWPKGVHVCDRTVDVHMAALRKALHIPNHPDPVRTVRGRGYSLDYVVWSDEIETLANGDSI